MKKGIIATALLALSIGCMIVFLSTRLCYWIPSMESACWIQEQVHGSTDVFLVHHSRLNTWQEKADFQILGLVDREDEARAALIEEAPECEIGKTAAYALGNGEEENALGVLESIALNATCLEVRKAAVRAIEGFGSDEARAALTRILLETAG